MDSKSDGPTTLYTLWKEYMRRYWVKDQLIEPYQQNQNPIERDMASWKNDCINIMIDSKIDPGGWFKVMQHAADLHNHTANQHNTD